MSNVIKHDAKLAALPDDFADKLVTGIDESRASTVIAGGGAALLRLIKSGEWVFGAQNTEVQEGSLWALNPITLAHGYSCWVEGEGNAKNTLQGEVMTSISEPKPIKPPPIDNTPYAEQRSFELLCLNGDDEGTPVLYKTASVGGMRAVDGLLVEIKRQLREDRAHPCPVLSLKVDSYPHPKWGKTFIPILEVVDWVDMNGNNAKGEAYGNGGGGGAADDTEDPEAAAAAAAEAEAEAAEAARAKAAAAAPAPRKPRLAAAGGVAAAPRPEPQPTVGQRRRPAVR